jgi:hypothetical protein
MSLCGYKKGWHGRGGRDLVRTEDYAYRTPSVHFLQGHRFCHFFQLYYGDGPLEGQKVPTRRVALRHYFSRRGRAGAGGRGAAIQQGGLRSLSRPSLGPRDNFLEKL